MPSISKFLLGLVASILIRHSEGFWREACSTIQTGRIDPILSPGQISGHVHKFSGASNVDYSSTNDTVQSATCTSCEVQQDKSLYWTPLLYFAHSNGTFEEVPNYGTTVYYLGQGDNSSNIVPFPPGFQMLSGNSNLRTYDNTTLTYMDIQPVADRVTFHCIDSSDPNLPEQHYMFRTNCDNGMRAQILFPSCWDGINLYLPNSAHVAFQSELGHGVCPPTHPVPLPLLFFEVLYWTIDIDQSQGGEFVFSQGDTTGYGFHGDFLNGWDQVTLAAAVDSCLSQSGNPDGTVSTCTVLAASDNVNFPRTCVEQPPVVPEVVHGLLKSLPGCNPINFGPGAASQNVCGVNTTVPISAALSFTSIPAAPLSTSISAVATPAPAQSSSTPSSISSLNSIPYPFRNTTSSFNPNPPAPTTTSSPTSNIPSAFFPSNSTSTSTLTSATAGPEITTFVTVTQGVTIDITSTDLVITTLQPMTTTATISTNANSTSKTSISPTIAQLRFRRHGTLSQ